MSLNQRTLPVFLTLILVAVGSAPAQQKAPQSAPSPSPSPTPVPTEAEQEPPVRVFTEEVRLPVVAVDAYGHYDPTVEPDDVLVLEDGVAQLIRSVRHIPANVLLLLDTGGETSGVGGLSKSTSLTREVAMEIVRRLGESSQVAVMQFSNSVEVIQPWTNDKQATLRTLKTKVSSGKRARFSEALAAAAQQLRDRPEGSRHVVMITDGVDTPGGKIDRAEAVKRLTAARATVHIISYTEYVRQKSDNKTTSVSKVQQRPANTSPITRTDPTLPSGTTRAPAFGVTITFDPAMKRLRKAYEAEVRKSQQVLTNVAEETGGKILLPVTSEEMIAQAGEVARAIGSEYVVTYRPKRPLAAANPGEYRRVQVSSRRVGLSLHSRRGYVVPSSRQE